MDLSHIICVFEHTKNLPLTECAKWLFFWVKSPKIEKKRVNFWNPFILTINMQIETSNQLQWDKILNLLMFQLF